MYHWTVYREVEIYKRIKFGGIFCDRIYPYWFKHYRKVHPIVIIDMADKIYSY